MPELVYIAISHNGWDLHANMFDRNSKVNHYTLCKELDNALTALITDLRNNKSAGGKTLLDKTFIVFTGEFGRTGGDLTVNKGRDHNRQINVITQNPGKNFSDFLMIGIFSA